MDAVQLTTQLRYVPLQDEEGKFGIFIVHDEDGRVRYTVEVTDDNQLWAALDSFRCDPVGVDLWLSAHTTQRASLWGGDCV